MTRVHELIRSELPPIDAELEVADDAMDRPDHNVDPDEVEAPATPTAAAAAEATTARATLDLGSWMSGKQLDGGRVALELPRSAATALGGLLRAIATAVESSPPAPP